MTVYDSSEEERSLLFSDNDPDSSQAGDTNNHIMSDDIDNDVLQWEDFMIDYWSRNNHNTNSSDDEQQLDITENAEMIIMMEDTDMAPHPLEPELDNISHLVGNHFNYPTKQHDMNIIDTVDSTAVVNGDDSATLIEKVLCEAGLQSTLQMAKLNATAAAATDNHSKFHRQTVQKKQQQQLLQEEFVIDMSHVPMTSSGATAGSGSKSKRKKRTKANAAGSNATAGGGVGSSSAQINNQKEVSSPGIRSESSRDTNCPQSTLAMMHPPASSPQQQQQQQEESLEESLFVMAKRLSPGNDDDHILSQQQQRRGSDKQQQPSQQQQQQQKHRRQHSATSSTTTSDTKLKLTSIKSIPTTLPPPPPPQHPSDSPLPNPNLIHQMGPIQTRTSLRSLLMKKWHPSWWMHYDSHSILIFRSKDHLDDWVQNPYHGRRERAYLVKLRVDFGDIVGASGAGGGSASGHLINSSSNSESGSPVRNSNTTKESGNILGHRILPIKRKSYNKNEPEMYQFKLERWTNMGVSVLAAFASEEEKEVELLYETIGRIMESCPFGGLHDIEHMLQH